MYEEACASLQHIPLEKNRPVGRFHTLLERLANGGFFFNDLAKLHAGRVSLASHQGPVYFGLHCRNRNNKERSGGSDHMSGELAEMVGVAHSFATRVTVFHPFAETTRIVSPIKKRVPSSC